MAMIGSTSALGREERGVDGKRPPGTMFVYDPAYRMHRTGPGHPERPARLDAVNQAIQKAKLDRRLLEVRPGSAGDEHVLRCHSEKYLEIVKKDMQRGADQLSTGDTPLCADSLDVARLAVGGVLLAVDHVFNGKARNAFCAVRPPGHHATRDAGMGFCVFNNAAIAARYAQQKHKIAKVLIVDWDVHHGNGTQDIFYADGSVFYFSTHQAPWYPGTGAGHETGTGKGTGTTLNRPFPAGSGRDEIVGAFQKDLVPAMKKFKPELAIISAGFDSRQGDPLGYFTLSDDDFRDLTRIMLELAHEHAGGRLISVLEGGYHLDGLGKAVAAHVGALAR